MYSDFEELLNIFNAHEVKYLIVGGHAVMLYTEQRGFFLPDWGTAGSRVSGLKFAEAWPNRNQSELASRKVWFIGRADLLRNKLASGRHIDLHDAESLK
jgi:hypothetical protein